MTGLVLLDAAIGVIFVLLVFSLIASAVQEALASAFNSRAATLKRGVKQLLGEEEITIDQLYSAREIAALKSPKRNWDPANIPKERFVTAVQRLDAGINHAREVVDGLDEMLADLPLGDDLRAEILNRKTALVAKFNQRKADLEARFEAMETEVTTWYRRHVDRVLFIIGFSLAAILNFNLISYTGELLSNDALRAQVVATAETFAASEELMKSYVAEVTKNQDDPAKALREGIQAISGSLESPGQQLGWRCGGLAACWDAETMGSIFKKLISWLVIGFGCTLGAKYWFDLLGVLINMRKRVAPKPPKPDETANAGQA